MLSVPITPIQKMGQLVIIFLCALLFCSEFAAASDAQCVYNLCVYRPGDRARHVPCYNIPGSALVRTVTCSLADDVRVYHICCIGNKPDIQASRQDWFRFVTQLRHLVSTNCLSRILCELSCLDSLNGTPRPDFPTVLDTDNEENREFVAAYDAGEGFGCFGVYTNFNETSCENSCKHKYSSCEVSELLKSNIINFRICKSITRRIHRFGMYLFDKLHCQGQKDILGALIQKFRTTFLNSSDICNWKTEQDLQNSWIRYLELPNTTTPEMTNWLRQVTYTEVQDFVGDPGMVAPSKIDC